MKRISFTFLLVGLFLAATPSSSIAQVGSCAVGSAEHYLTVNNVRARLFNSGNLFWKGSPDVYTVPKDGGVNAIFTSGIWLGGYVNNSLRVAGSTYGPYEFFPGPVDAVVNGEDCSAYDRIYRIADRDMSDLDAGGTPSRDVADWPWQLGAPVIDGDGNPNNYDLAAGDRPELLGGESLFWIMNDVGNVHARTGSSPLGVEVHVTAFAAASANPDIDNSTFYRYKFINKNALPIEDMYLGLFADPDLGNFDDDYVGSNPGLNMVYVYNSDDDDEGGYGVAPPAVGYKIIGGTVSDSDGLDNDNDGSIDEPGEELGLASFIFYNNGGGVQGDPANGSDYYNYMRGVWKDGNPITEGGNGYQSGGPVTSFMYSGNPPGFWSEFDSDGLGNAIAPSDRRFASGVGPFTLAPGESTEIFFGILWARGTDNLDSVNELFATASRLDGIQPGDISSDPAPIITETPGPLVPANGASGQPLDLTLTWTFSGSPDAQFQLEIAENTQFDSASTYATDATQQDLSNTLAINTQYFWRVRAFNASSYGAWSNTFSFSTGEVEFANLSPFIDFVVAANAGGPLVPPVGASADWEAFPGTGRPDATQQVGPAHWLISTFQTNACANGDCGPYSTFLSRVVRNGIGRVVPYDLEIRFDSATNYALDWWTSGTAAQVPFSIWRSDAGTTGNTSDDVRLVPVMFDIDGNSQFNLQALDHTISAADNDPYTDAIYFYTPLDQTPGESGYNAWLNEAQTSSGDGFTELGDEIIGRVSLVSWNGSNGPTADADFVAALPEVGTVFRLEGYGSAFPPPVLSTPGDLAYQAPGDVSFSWVSATEGTDRLVIASDAALTSIVSDVPSASPPSIVNLGAGTYYWRIERAGGGGHSETWSFTLTPPANFDYTVTSGWNMVGVPFSSDDMSTSGLFGASPGRTVSTFEGQYVDPVADQVDFGRAYWVNFSSGATVSNDVFLRSQFDVLVEPGWNMISGPNCSLPTANLTGDTGVLAAGTQFAYSGGAYVFSSSFESGTGYWIFADAAGTITLDCALAKGGNQGSDLDLLDTFVSFTLTPEGSMPQVLYFGSDLPDELSPMAFSLPPIAPSQQWRAQYEDGRYVTEQPSATVSISGATFPIVIDRGAIEEGESLLITVLDNTGQILDSAELAAGESFQIDDSQSAALQIASTGSLSTDTEDSQLPERFTVSQNYPNPFNPVTNIEFAVPTTEVVTIVVLDVTGREVVRVADAVSFSPGWHSIRFNGDKLPSGVYFYRIQTQTESMVRRMVLLK